MNNVLCIAVHADDETLGCGGTLLKHKANGDEIYWLLVTHPSQDPKVPFSPEAIERRTQTIARVAERYGFTKTFNLHHPAALLHDVDMVDLVKSIDAVFDEVKPNIVYMMFNNDVHSDHRIAFEAAYGCTKSFRKPYIEQVSMFEAMSETEFAPAIPSASFVPNMFVDITDYIDEKLEIMSMFSKQTMPEPYPRSLGSIKATARMRGSRAGVMYAEAFMVLFERR